ncbi:BlaI/MecI/CopY family transcriptional regulator [Microbacterium sp. As-52]|uniref:BlaI/MecI/CopY family transcriptional regulator n=1 Tax=Microbacterium sp. As-52 TaxID=3390503 RepID=UPI003CF68229
MNSSGDGPREVFRLGALESQVMNVLWEHGPATVREVIDGLPTDPAYTTIATVLGNLDRKGLLVITRQGRSTRYAAGISRQEHAAGLIDQVLAGTHDRVSSILQFVDSMPANEIDLLREYLDHRNEAGRP